MMKKKYYKKIAAFLIMSFMVCAFAFEGSSDVTIKAAQSYQGQIDEAQKKRDELAAQKKALADKIANLNLDKDNLYKYMEELDAEYTALYADYEVNCQEKEKLQVQLEETQADFEYYKALEAYQYELMKKRVQYMYEHGNNSFLEIIIAAGSISELFNQAEYRQQITKYDNNLLAEYKETKENRSNTELVLSAQLEELEALQALQEEQLATLEQMSVEKNAELQTVMAKLDIDEEMLLDYVAEISAADVNIAELKKKEAERLAEEERKRQEELKKAQSQSINNIRWPLDSNRTVITSYFGWRERPIAGATTNHNGIDIGSPTGTNVYAAIAGTVIVASYQGGAGNMVRIDHGNGVVTDYMHASKLCVSVGDYVQRGQLIMKVGSTGISTGPHLHFTIRINGTPVNPLNYVTPGKVD